MLNNNVPPQGVVFHQPVNVPQQQQQTHPSGVVVDNGNVPPQQYQPVQQYMQPQQMPMQQQYHQPQQFAQPPQQQFAQPPVQPNQPSQVPAVSDAEQQVSVFLDQAGLTAAQVEQEYTVLGQVSATTRKALVDKHGEPTANLIVNQINSIATSRAQQSQASNQLVLNTVKEALSDLTQQDPSESFAELKTWAVANMSQEERNALNGMFDAGGVQAKLGVQHLVNAYKAGNGVSVKANLLEPNNANGSGSNSALDGATYYRELDKAVKEFGYDSQQVANLNARRERALASGIA